MPPHGLTVSLDDVDEEPNATPDYANLVVLSFSFTMLFMAFHSTQGFYTTFHPQYGGYILGVLYIAFSISTLFSPLVERFLSPKLCLILGASTYYVFVAFASLGESSFVAILLSFLSSFVNGLGSGILWTSQGTFLVLSSTKSHLGLSSGIFFAFFQMSIFLGFALSGLLLRFVGESSQWILPVVLGWCAWLGVALMFLLRVEPKKKKGGCGGCLCFGSFGESIWDCCCCVKRRERQEQGGDRIDSNEKDTFTLLEEEEEGEGEDSLLSIDLTEMVNTSITRAEQPSFLSLLLQTARVLLDLKFLLLLIIFFFSGYSFGFYYSTLSKTSGKDLLPWCFLVFSICGIIAAIGVGRFGDLVSRRYAMIFVMFLHFISVCLTFTMKLKNNWLIFLTWATCGAANTGLNTQIYAILGLFFHDNPAAGFAAFKFVQCIFVAFSMSTSSVFSFFQTEIILCFGILFGLVGFFLVDWIAPVERKTHPRIDLLVLCRGWWRRICLKKSASAGGSVN